MPEASDDLLQRASDGDANALSELLAEFGPRVREHVHIDRKWAGVLDPDDVMQVTYLEAFLQIRRFQPQGTAAFVGWLRRIADNNLRDAVKELGRQKRPQPEQRIAPPTRDESVAALLDVLNATHSTPSRVAAGREAGGLLEQALAELPPDYAAVVRLYDLEGKAIGDVAAQLGRSPGAVHMLRSRAHEHLRSALGSESQFFSRGA